MSLNNKKPERTPETPTSAPADRPRLGETSLRLVTVASEQRRVDALRLRRRDAHRADRERRLLAVFGTPSRRKHDAAN